MSDTHCLVGKVITAVSLASDKKAMRFEVTEGEAIRARATGDCCSRTWIEHVENPQALMGSAVLSARNIEMPSLPTTPDQDKVQFYGFQIETAKGTCVIEYRNESHAYYGGSLVWPGDYYYRGADGQNVSTKEWRLLA